MALGALDPVQEGELAPALARISRPPWVAETVIPHAATLLPTQIIVIKSVIR